MDGLLRAYDEQLRGDAELLGAARVALIGLRGAGKSTLGKLVAERLGWTFVELNAEIERENALSVPEIFAIYGQDRDDRALSPATGEAFGTLENGGEARAASKAGASGIAELSQAGRAGKALRTDANTNLMVPRAVLPTLMGEHAAGEKDIWLVTGVFGIPSVGDREGAPEGWEVEWRKRPTIPEEIAALMK